MKKNALLYIFAGTVLNVYAQNVGIGTKAPGYVLTVKDTTGSGGGIGIAQVSQNGQVAVGTYVDNNNAYIQTHTNYPLSFATNNNSTQMILMTNGRVGINSGQVNNQQLNLGGAIRIGNTMTGEQGAIRYNDADSSYETYNKNSWQSIANDFSIVGQSNNGDLTFFSSPLRNQYVPIPAISYTVRKSGYYLMILSSDGSSGIQEKNNIYDLNDNRTDFAGAIRLAPVNNPVSRFLVKGFFSSHLDNNGDPTQDQTIRYTSIDGDISAIRYLTTGEVIQGYAYIEQSTGSSGSIPAQQQNWYTHVAAKFILLK